MDTEKLRLGWLGWARETTPPPGGRLVQTAGEGGGAYAVQLLQGDRYSSSW